MSLAAFSVLNVLVKLRCCLLLRQLLSQACVLVVKAQAWDLGSTGLAGAGEAGGTKIKEQSLYQFDG